MKYTSYLTEILISDFVHLFWKRTTMKVLIRESDITSDCELIIREHEPATSLLLQRSRRLWFVRRLLLNVSSSRSRRPCVLIEQAAQEKTCFAAGLHGPNNPDKKTKSERTLTLALKHAKLAAGRSYCTPKVAPTRMVYQITLIHSSPHN